MSDDSWPEDHPMSDYDWQGKYNVPGPDNDSTDSEEYPFYPLDFDVSVAEIEMPLMVRLQALPEPDFQHTRPGFGRQNAQAALDPDEYEQLWNAVSASRKRKTNRKN